MALTTYTTLADIRAVLGVSSDEIDDATLSLEVYEFGLIDELRSISKDLPSDYAAVAGDSSRDEDSEDLYRAVRLFSAYAVAQQLTGSLPLFSPKDITDGKAGFSRYSDSPYKEVIKRIREQFDRYKKTLIDTYASYNSSSVTSTPINLVSVSSPTYDPITG